MFSLLSGRPNLPDFMFQLIKQFDQDASGMVEFEEFVRVMAKKAENSKIALKEEEFRNAFKVTK